MPPRGARPAGRRYAYPHFKRPAAGPPELIHAAADKRPFSSFVWRSDSSELFFNLGMSELLKFTPASGLVETIAP